MSAGGLLDPHMVFLFLSILASACHFLLSAILMGVRRHATVGLTYIFLLTRDEVSCPCGLLHIFTEEMSPNSLLML